MDELNQAERFKKLIKKGFDIQDISFEFNIPIEQLKKWEQELVEETKQVSRKVSTYNEGSAIKMQQMREKYRQLFFPPEKTEKKQEAATTKQSSRKELSEAELENVTTTIETIEQKVGQIKSASKTEARKIIISVIEQLSKIKEYKPLPMQMAERLKNAIYTIDIVKASNEDRLPSVIKNSKMLVTARLVEAIEREQEKLEDVKELQRLYGMLTSEMERNNRLIVGRLKSVLQRKISDLQIKNALNKLRNDIPQSILEVIEGLASGEINLEEANKIITDEAKRKAASRSLSKFPTTEEQERRQVLIQIRMAITENPDKYRIKNPEKTIQQMQELSQGERGESIRAVVTNLIGAKQFTAAKIVCSRLLGTQNDQYTVIILQRLQEEIKKAEISDLVLSAINIQTSPENDAKNFDSLELGLKRREIKPNSVSLGKSEDGKREITLGDIWPDDNKESRVKGIRR